MVIIVDGVVGAGKSTLAEKLSNKLNIPVHFELQSQVTMDLLEEFYKDKKRWSFTLQVHFLNERFKMIKEISKKGTGILDRSIFGDKIFASMLYEDGYMTKEEYYTYSGILDNMLEHSKSPSLLVYIDCNLETAIERIGIRGREMEQKVDEVYWKRLNEKYTKWYSEYRISPKMLIDAKSYHPNNDDDINKISDKVLSLLKNDDYMFGPI